MSNFSDFETMFTLDAIRIRFQKLDRKSIQLQPANPSSLPSSKSVLKVSEREIFDLVFFTSKKHTVGNLGT